MALLFSSSDCLLLFLYAYSRIMIRIYFIILSLFIASQIFSQSQFEIVPENNGSKIWKGLIARDVLEKDTSFASWYLPNRKAYAPNKETIAALQKNADSLELIVFMGTWCEDSHFVVPKLLSLVDAAGFPKNRVSLIGVDRDKKTLGNLSEALNVTNVPTIIVMKKGKELGRVIEYGKSGMFDKDLGEIIQLRKM